VISNLHRSSGTTREIAISQLSFTVVGRPFAACIWTSTGTQRKVCLNITSHFAIRAEGIAVTAPNLGDVANIEELRVTVETPQSAPPFPAILAFLSTTRFPSLRMLEMEIRPTWPVASLPDRYLPLPHDLVDRLHHVRLVFGRGYDTIQDIEMERMLSVFRREGQPDIVEVDLGTAALTAGPTQGACHCIIIPPPCLGMRNWH
jgi:hypothetical protein